MPWLLILLVCTSPPTMGYEGCARWSIKMPDERSCHDVGQRHMWQGDAQDYHCQPIAARQERGA